MTRQQLEMVFRPVSGAGRQWETAVQIATRYGDITVKTWHAAMAWSHSRIVGTPPIVDDAALADFIHEIGHCLDAGVDHRASERKLADGSTVSTRGEASAWRHAIDILGRHWNAAMDERLRVGLLSYATYVDFEDDVNAINAIAALSSYRSARYGVVTADAARTGELERAALAPHAAELESLGWQA